jgi:hypothetical protein
VCAVFWESRGRACPFTLCRRFFTPKIVWTFYMQGAKLRKKQQLYPIVPPISKLSGHPEEDEKFHDDIITSLLNNTGEEVNSLLDYSLVNSSLHNLPVNRIFMSMSFY